MGFKRETEEAGFSIFARQQTGYAERIGVTAVRRDQGTGETEIEIVMGIEFKEYDREPFWLGMPRTHGGATPLRLLNKAAKTTYRCSSEFSPKELASTISALVPDACSELLRRRDKIFKAYEGLLSARVQNVQKRMAILGERLAKDLRAGKSTSSSATASRALEKRLNLPEILEALLKSLSDKRHELESFEFDELESRDRNLTKKRIAQLIDHARQIEPELTNLLGVPVSSGNTEHKSIPINGIRYYVQWCVGWKLISLVVSHEDIGLPCMLEMAVTARRKKKPPQKR